jgi:hypothetical protein
MRRISFLAVLLLAGVAAVSAAPLCTGVYGTNVLTPGFSCELGGLTFSNFSASQIGLGTDPIIAISAGITGHETGVSGSTVQLYFQTNFNLVLDQFRDISFAYTVTGGVIGVDGWMGGAGTRSIAETVYSDSGHNNVVGVLNLTGSSPSGEALLSGSASEIYIVKDITLGTGATMSEFTQSFETPEPLTFGLIGSGLVLLGLLRRRTRG